MAVFQVAPADFVLGISVEAAVGGPIGLLKDGDIINIDAEAGSLDVKLSDEEMAERKAAWQPRETQYTSGALHKVCSVGWSRT